MFVLSLSILMLEIAVARMFSVAMLSHFAFVAISLAMFGIAGGGLHVYLRLKRFPPARLDEQLVRYSWQFGLAAALASLLFLQMPAIKELSLWGALTLTAAYLTLAVPFYLGGVAVSLLMTHFSAHIGRIYFADLLGASVGCLAVVLAMQQLPATLVPALVAVAACACAVMMARLGAVRSGVAPLLAAALSIAILGAGLTTDAFKMRYTKGRRVPPMAYETWNAFSRVSAFPHRKNAAQIVPLNNPDAYSNVPATMGIDIDGAAFTPMMNFKGDLGTVQFLRDSVLYAAHWLKPKGSVLIIGIGGGRDVIAALAAGQAPVLGIELNPLIRHVVDERFGNYSGRPYSRPGVEVIIDEGRSRLSHLDQQFDVIQLSLIDTFALNAAGGFVFSENYLYTVEAFREYFRHLSPDGILSLTRYFRPHYPLEIQRLAAMVRVAWSAEGVANPAQHVVVLYKGLNATMLVKRSPFTQEDIATLQREAYGKGFQILASPGLPRAFHQIAHILTTPNLHRYLETSPYNLDPPTDDQPFFFNFLRGRLAKIPSAGQDPFRFLEDWDEALALMYLLIGVVTALALLFLIGPLLLAGRGAGAGTGRAVPMLLYFACLGYGFMMVEIPLLQRFTLLLGYPTYALVVVLFALLLFSGVGSLATARFHLRPAIAVRLVLAGVLILGLAYAMLLPAITHPLLSAPLATRIAATIALLAPIGLLLGMPYPLGIAVLRGLGDTLVPWAWALNGALGVVASVLAAFVGSRYGFTTALFSGIAAYGLALAMTFSVSAGSERDSEAEPQRSVA
jgi:spermidine synthase